MSQIRKRLDQILPEIKKKDFLSNKGLGNEIGFYLFDYDPKDELIVRDHIDFLIRKMNNNPDTADIVEFDLFNIMIEILEDKGYLEKTFKMEKKKDKIKMVQIIKTTVSIFNNAKLFINYISKRIEKNQIIFITGVGKAWPIVRSHKVLNNLHSKIEDNPLVLFFPGSYDGASLSLFGDIYDNNYYRAFSLVPRKDSVI
jgi:hypothetical protein